MGGSGRTDAMLVSTAAPGRVQTRLALLVVGLLVAAMLVAAPFARAPLADTAPLLPAYAAATLVNELITAALLLALYAAAPSRALLVLAAGYLFSGLLAIPWALTFPGVFGFVDAGLQSTASIAALRRVGFPLFVLAYALLRHRAPTDVAEDRRGPSRAIPSRAIVGCVLAVVLAAAALSWLAVAGETTLPRWMRDASTVTAAWTWVPATAAVLCVASLALLGGGRRSMLDLWLMVVLCALLTEILLLAVLGGGGRFSVGWWAGRAFGLAASSVVLLALLAETTTLYARLARAAAAERQAREARLTTLEALAAAIAHELAQPLASMVTNAGAGLRWLDRDETGEARAALARIVDDGRCAGQVVTGIRTMFEKGARERAAVDLAGLIGEALDGRREETRRAGVEVRVAVAAGLPPVAGNRVQLRQVLSNLVANAVEAMEHARRRVLAVSAARLDADLVEVAVADTGPGTDPGARERLFEPFYTTRPHGMGMGLMISRWIVESHGGRLWAEDAPGGGAVFRFTLPVHDVGGEA